MNGYDRMNNVLNGIAYDSENDEFYMTGKRWNFVFKIKLNWLNLKILNFINSFHQTVKYPSKEIILGKELPFRQLSIN